MSDYIIRPDGTEFEVSGTGGGLARRTHRAGGESTLDAALATAVTWIRELDCDYPSTVVFEASDGPKLLWRVDRHNVTLEA